MTRDDAGAGAVVAIGVLAMVMMALAVAATVMGERAAAARVETIADATALAGAVDLREARASRAQDPEGVACRTAAIAARRMRAVLADCDANAATGVIRVEVTAGVTRAAVAGPRPGWRPGGATGRK